MSTSPLDHLYDAVTVGGDATRHDRDLGRINDCDH